MTRKPRNVHSRFSKQKRSAASASKTFRPSLEPLEQRQMLTVIHAWDFEQEGLGTYTDGEIREDFRIAGPANSHNPRLYSHNSASIVNDTINGETTKVMRILHAANQVSAGFEMTVDLGKDYDELYLSYDFKFDKEFCSTKGGKLSGMYGWPPVTTQNYLDPSEGFLSRTLYKQGGSLTTYHYDRTYNAPSPWAAEDYKYNSIYFTNGNWYNITQRMVMNAFTNGVANADGINEVWVDGRLIFQETNLKLMARQSYWETITNDDGSVWTFWEPMKIDAVALCNFYGGPANDGYEPVRDTYGYVDNFTVFLPDDDPTVGTRSLHNPQSTMPTPDAITDRTVVYDTLVTAPGTVKTSTYPNNYSLCTDETFLIDAGPGNKVTYQITAGTLADATLLAIYDGNQTDSPLIAERWGTSSPVGTYTSTGRYMFVRMSTDALSTAKGFTGNVTFSAQSSTPAAPNRLLATPFSANQINLTWTDNSTNETAFEIDRATNSSFTSGLVTATVAAGVTSYASTGLAVGTTYYYRIRSTVGGSTDSVNSKITNASTRPNAPTGLTAMTVTMNQVNLTWSDTSTQETCFEIDRATDSSFTAGLVTATVAAGVTSYQSTGLSQNTTYYYRVRSSRGSVGSAESNTSAATTSSGFTGTFYSVASEDGYVYESSETSGLGGGFNATAVNDGLRVGDTSTKQQLKSILSFDTSSIPEGATIVSATLRLRRSGSAGTSPVYWGGNFLVDIKGGSGFGDSVALAVTDFESAADATGVAQLSNPMGNGLWAEGMLSGGLQYVNTAGKTQFRVYFQNDDDNNTSDDRFNIYSGAASSGYRPELIIEYTVGPVTPTPPTDLNATAVSTSQINLTWTDTSNNETSFEIEQATNSAFSAGLTTATVAANATSYQSTGLAPNTTYYYRVRATIDGTTDSTNSNTASAAISAVDVRWNGATGNVWAAGVGNWKNTVDGSPANYIDGVGTVFDDTATGLTADISTNDVTPTSVTFNNTNKSFTITGSKGIAGATTTVTKTGAGTVTLSGANTYGGVTAMDEGTIILQGAAMNPVLNGGGADIMGGMLMFDYAGGASPAATVRSLLAQSFHAGAFDTGKFQSSAATTQLCLGWIDNTGSSKISVVYTIYGDANLDGTTDFSDLGKLLAHYNQPGVWADGDFNYDGMVDFSDLGKLLANYNKSRDSILLQVAGDNIVSQAAALVQESAMTVSAASSATTTATVDAASSAIDDIAAPVASHRPAHSGLAAASSKARDRYVFSRAAAVAQAFADTDLSSDLGDEDVTDTVAKATTATTYAWRHNARSAFAAGPRR